MEKPIRILHVLGCLDRGGAETMVMNLYHSIDRTKVQFDFVVHTDEKCDFDDEVYNLGGMIYRIPHYTGKNHFAYKKAWKSLLESHPEYKIIHGHMRSTATIYMKIAKKCGLITIAHSHSTASRGNKFEHFVKRIMQFPIRNIADYLFACSDEAGKWLFGSRCTKKHNYSIIKNAIDVKNYLYDETRRNEIRQMLNIEGKFVVGHVGSFTYPKNHKFLIDIFYEIQKQVENSILLLVGDGQLRPQILKQINSLGIKDKVVLTGVVSNVNDYLQSMDIFVFPSIFEGFGISIIEAQVSGLKCLVSDAVPTIVDVNDHIERISLKRNATIWKDIILRYENNNYNRKFISSGNKFLDFNINENALNMENRYLQMIGENIDGNHYSSYTNI